MINKNNPDYKIYKLNTKENQYEFLYEKFIDDLDNTEREKLKHQYHNGKAGPVECQNKEALDFLLLKKPKVKNEEKEEKRENFAGRSYIIAIETLNFYMEEYKDLYQKYKNNGAEEKLFSNYDGRDHVLQNQIVYLINQIIETIFNIATYLSMKEIKKTHSLFDSYRQLDHKFQEFFKEIYKDIYIKEKIKTFNVGHYYAKDNQLVPYLDQDYKKKDPTSVSPKFLYYYKKNNENVYYSKEEIKENPKIKEKSIYEAVGTLTQFLENWDKYNTNSARYEYDQHNSIEGEIIPCWKISNTFDKIIDHFVKFWLEKFKVKAKITAGNLNLIQEKFNREIDDGLITQLDLSRFISSNRLLDFQVGLHLEINMAESNILDLTNKLKN